MKPPRPVPLLDREVRTWTENISDAALADVVNGPVSSRRKDRPSLRHSLYRRLQSRRIDGVHRSTHAALFRLSRPEGFAAGGGVDIVARLIGQLAKDALGAPARHELGISEITTARPVQAALTPAASFSVGAAMPLLMVVVSPPGALVPLVSAASLGFLALLGAIGARIGGANVLRATARVTFWGALAMALTAGIGKLFGPVV
jgi:VIT family